MKYYVVDIRKESDKIAETFFDEFYNSSIFTWTGQTASDDEFKTIIKELHLEEPVFYVFSGKQMNDIYKLTGSNKYQDDLTFVSIKDYYNIAVRFRTGARWFDDIVDNNARREGRFHDTGYDDESEEE